MSAKSDKEARKQRILDTAAELIIRYGYDKTTVSDIANATGVSKGSIYLYFESKDELFEALLLREMWRYGEAYLAAVEADPQGGTLGGIYKNVLFALNSNQFMGAIMRQARHIFGNYLRKPNNIFQSVESYTMTAGFIQALQEAGTVRSDMDPAVIAHIIEMLGYGFFSITDTTEPARIPPVEVVFEAIATMMDRAFTPEDGGDSEAGKAVIRRITAAAREQFDPTGEPQKERSKK